MTASHSFHRPRITPSHTQLISHPIFFETLCLLTKRWQDHTIGTQVWIRWHLCLMKNIYHELDSPQKDIFLLLYIVSYIFLFSLVRFSHCQGSQASGHLNKTNAYPLAGSHPGNWQKKSSATHFIKHILSVGRTGRATKQEKKQLILPTMRKRLLSTL